MKSQVSLFYNFLSLLAVLISLSLSLTLSGIFHRLLYLLSQYLLSLTHAVSLSPLSLSHTHTHTHFYSLFPSCTHSHSLVSSLSHSLTLAHTLTLISSLSLTLAHTHTHTHTHTSPNQDFNFEHVETFGLLVFHQYKIQMAKFKHLRLRR